MSVTRINEFQAAEEKEEELYGFLQSLTEYISSSDGCESFEVLRCKDNSKEFVVLEKWDSEASHQASIANYPHEKMQEAMILFGAPPKGRYFA